MGEQQSHQTPELYRSETPVAYTTIENRHMVPLFLAEVPVTIESRVKNIDMHHLALVEYDGNKQPIVRASLGAAAGILHAVGETIWQDQHAVDTLLNAQAANPLDSPIPEIHITPATPAHPNGGIEQYSVALGHTFLETLSILNQQTLLLSPTIASPGQRNLLTSTMIEYHLLRKIAKTLGAVEAFHNMGLRHGDVGQFYHLDNALIDPVADRVFLIDYAHTRLVSPHEDLDPFIAETMETVKRMKALLQQAKLESLARLAIGSTYDDVLWNPGIFMARASNLIDKMITLNEITDVPLTHQQAYDIVKESYLRSYLYWRSNNALNKPAINVLYSQIPGLSAAIHDYYMQQNTLRLQQGRQYPTS